MHAGHKEQRGRSCQKRGVVPIVLVEGWGRVLIDTGATNTLVDEAKAVEIVSPEEIISCKCSLTTVSGESDLLGNFLLGHKPLTGDNGTVRVHVTRLNSTKYDIIAGTDVLQERGCRVEGTNDGWVVKIGRETHKVIRSGKLKERLFNGVTECGENQNKAIEARIYREFESVFYKEGEPLSATGRVQHAIDLIDDTPVFVKPYRQPHEKLIIIREQIKELLDQGIIRKSVSPYCSPLVVVPKAPGPDGKPKYRVVVDYRELNRKTRVEKHPVPRLEEIIDRMAGAKVFSTIDLKAGYHQIRVDPRDTHKTAFQFERGKYEFLRMPFGLRNAPTTFQKVMDEFLLGMEPQVQIYMDDVLVFSKTEEEHGVHLLMLLKRLKEYGLKVSREKTRLFCREVKFLGHILSAKGIRPDEGKIEAIRAMPVPRSVKEIRSFLGMINYYRRFGHNLSGAMEPLNKLLKKGSRVQIDDTIRASTQRCKDIICTAPILAYPNFEKRFIVTTDASDVALGAVLSQYSDEARVDLPIEYASRKLNPAETRYSTIEREMLGVVWAVEKFRPYVWGTSFTVRTDHMPLKWLYKLKETSSRITRWKERLAPYDFEVIHTKGSENVVADCLSRNIDALEMDRQTDEPENIAVHLREGTGNEPNLHLTQRTSQDPPTRPQRRTIRRENTIINDKFNQLIFNETDGRDLTSTFEKLGRSRIISIFVGKDTTDYELTQYMSTVTQIGKTYHIYAGENRLLNRIIDLYERTKISQMSEMIVCHDRVRTLRDRDEQVRTVERYHQGITNHRGPRETVQHLRREYYWPAMLQTVQEINEGCATCNKAKYNRRPRETPMVITETPAKPWAIVEMDLFTWCGTKYLTIIDRFSRIAIARNIASKSAVDITEALLEIFGQYGRPNKIITDRGREFNNKRLTDVLREFEIEIHYTTAGHYRSHGTIERLHGTLTEHLQLLQMDRQITGREAVARAILAYNSSIHSVTGLTPLEIMFRQTNLMETALVQDRTNREKEKRTTDFNRTKATDIYNKIKIGDEVFVRNFCKRRKSDPRYKGPYIVVQKLGHFRIEVESVAHPGHRSRVVHTNEIKWKKCSQVKSEVGY